MRPTSTRVSRPPTASVLEKATVGRDALSLPSVELETGQGVADTNALNWARWRVTPGEDRGDGWAYSVCPRCHQHANADAFASAMAHLSTGLFFCAACGHHGDAKVAPNQYRLPRVPLTDPWWQPLSEEALEAHVGGFLPAGLPVGLDVGLGQGLVAHREGHVAWEPALTFPCRQRPETPPTGLLLLPLSQAGGFDGLLDLPNTEGVPWGWDAVDGQSVVFVDHPFDRIALLMAGVTNAVCLPPRMNPMLPGGGDWSVLGLIEKQLAGIGRVVMALRDDEAGHRLEEELARRIGKDRCFRVRWQNHRTDSSPTCAQTVLSEHGADVLFEAIEKAPAFPVAGVHELFDVEESFDVLYEFGLQPGVSTGWPSLDLLYTVKLGQWTVLTGIPGHGKSSFIDALAVNLAQMHGWRFGVFSPENQPIERHYASLMEKAAGAPFSEGMHPRITVDTKNRLKGWLNEHFKIILPDEDNDGNWSVDGILGLARTLVYRHGIRGLIIDPWNELNHIRPPHVTEADYVAMELTKIRRFARTYGVHVWVVVHPNKQEKGSDGKYAVITPYMLAGGANWRNKADNILSGYRNLLQADAEIFDIYVQKIRFKEVGRLGRASLRGDPLCGQYIDDIDQDKRDRALRQPTPVATAQQCLAAPRLVRHGSGMPIERTQTPLPTTFL